MRIPNHFQRVILFLLTCLMLWALFGCGSSQNHRSPQEQAEGYYWFEAFFLDKEEVEKVFYEISDNYPQYDNFPDDYHVTMYFKPEPMHEDLYGSPVTVHIIGYASGSIQDSQGNYISDNEGLLVELSSTDERMQTLIDSSDRTWHITGSYSNGAKYTDQLDFSKGKVIDITIKGVFGMGDSEGVVKLE